MTIKETYRLSTQKLKEAGIKSSEIDARILICHVLNISLEKFILDLAREISPAEIKKINNLIKKRALNIPVAYLIGQKEFFGLNFLVNKNVLIPRPETEYLVELAMRSFANDSVLTADFQDDTIKVLDIGTGSGNIIISLLLSLRAKRSNLSTSLRFFASDVSSKSLAVAKQNAKLNTVDKKIKFYKSDLFSNKKLQQKFDLIIANLPYVPKENRDISVKFEPVNAIFTSDNGAEIIKKFLKQAPDHLKNTGTILIELDPRNADDILNFAKKYFPKHKIRLEKDLAGFMRYLIIEN